MSRPIKVIGDKAFIALTRGYEAVIDAADVYLVSGRNWSAHTSPRRNAVYACRMETISKKQHMIMLHRLLLVAPPPLEIDHIDGNGLNNCRANLRVCSRSENVRNTGLRADNKSGFKGVFFEARAARWRAEIRTDHKSRHLGYFSSPELAHAAYQKASAEDHGKFARLP